MVNSKAVIGIVVVIVIAIISVSFGVQSDETMIPVSSTEPNVFDSASVEKDNQNFAVDEQGNKQFQISVGDAPDLGD